MREEWSCVYQGFGEQFVTIDGTKRAQRLSAILLGYLEVIIIVCGKKKL